jgi:hypothetical protein
VAAASGTCLSGQPGGPSLDGAHAVAVEVALRGVQPVPRRSCPHACHEWTATVPEETAAMGRMIQFPDVAGAVASTRTRLR